MLYYINYFSDGGDFFNLFRYITFRSGGAFFTSLVFFFIFGPTLISLFKKKQKGGQPIRSDGPETHILKKAGTPTMGGVIILGSLLFSSLLWSRLDNYYVWLVLSVTLGFGIIGFVDDYKKVVLRTSIGLSKRVRLIAGFCELFLASKPRERESSNVALIEI